MSESSSEGSEREDITLVDALEIGSRLTYLRQAGSQNHPLINHESTDMYILAALWSLEQKLARVGMSPGVVSDIAQKRNELQDEYLNDDEGSDETDSTQDEENNSTPMINNRDGRELANATDSWVRIIRTELGNEVRIPVFSEGILNIDRAMKDPSSLFQHEGIWEDLPSQTQDDLAEACRTAAASCPTATVFLCLRAVEERLGTWYVTETDHSIDTETFGQVLSNLDDTYDESSRPSILSHLDYLRDRRNEVAHPTHSPNMQEAVSTLVTVRQTISDIQERL
ncbi:hypothetical protein MUK72_06735 [Halococcus dombrowskii]|nr:hypothetical protein [Halococcus dombrowskii]UOO96392.1 hypothetical protein MUK72_06735 [Halococcus dombrowskii]